LGAWTAFPQTRLRHRIHTNGAARAMTFRTSH
jgi:hypothetical protein